MVTDRVKKVLIIEDDVSIGRVLQFHLKSAGFETTLIKTGEEGVKKFAEEQIDCVLCDLSLPGINGIEVLEKINPSKEKMAFIILTAFGKIDNAVKAIKYGAFNYLTKPIKPETLILEIQNAIEFFEIKKENLRLNYQVSQGQEFNELVGNSPPMHRLKEILKRLSMNNNNLLIHGESGTGKTLVARILHENGPRRKCPFLSINCGAIPQTLIESELFGHVKGSFTGAIKEHLGVFEMANTGTLLLDEIGDLPLYSQVKLLKVIEEGTFFRVGGEKQIKVD
ncbi:sigma-54-dependent transcriptional regulator, partial [Candidatus Riflebacteria bacterium]